MGVLMANENVLGEVLIVNENLGAMSGSGNFRGRIFYGYEKGPVFRFLFNGGFQFL